MSRLTQHQCNTTPPNASGHRLLSDGNGLYLRIQPGGTRSWLFRYFMDGKARAMSLGRAGAGLLTLTDARALAAQHRKAIADGGNPAVERTAARTAAPATLTVRDFGTEYLRDHVRVTAGFKRPEEVDRMFNAYVFPAIGDVLLARVSKTMATDVLMAIVKRGSRVQANRMLAQFKKFFAFAMTREYIKENPLQFVTAKMIGGKEKKRTRVLKPCEVWRVFHMLDHGDTKHAWQTRDALRLVLLTGQRSGEVLGALTRKNLSRDGSRWTIPLGFFKSSEHHDADHVVHLSAQAQDAISVAWYRDNPLRERVFIESETPHAKLRKEHDATTRGLSKAVARMLAAPPESAGEARRARRSMKAGPLHGMAPWTPHDLRRTFSTACGEMGVSLHVVEKCLNHKLEGVLAVYQQGEWLREREMAFALWGEVVDTLLALPAEPDPELTWSDLRPQHTAQVIAHNQRAA